MTILYQYFFNNILNIFNIWDLAWRYCFFQIFYNSITKLISLLLVTSAYRLGCFKNSICNFGFIKCNNSSIAFFYFMKHPYTPVFFSISMSNFITTVSGEELLHLIKP